VRIAPVQRQAALEIEAKRSASTNETPNPAGICKRQLADFPLWTLFSILDCFFAPD